MTNLVKKCLNNWKFSAIILVVSVILNIIFLCQPVFGTYRGDTKYRAYINGSEKSETYQTILSFNGGCATVNYTKGDTTSYNVGVYQKIENEIVIITSLTYPEGVSLDTRRRFFTRESVFVLSQGENQYISGSAISTQTILTIIDLVFVIRVISQLKPKKQE